MPRTGNQTQALNSTASNAARASSKASGTPKGWPSGVTYISKPVYSKALNLQTLESLNSVPKPLPANVVKMSSNPAQLVRITAITESSHPANGQCGLFATQSLPPDTFILPYLGYFHVKEDADPNSDYDLSLDRELGVGVDATRMGNEARFINDYRGVGPPGPNAEFREMLVDMGNGKLIKVMGVFVRSAGKNAKGKRAKGISKGDEILVSYGKGFWSERRKEQEMS